MLWSVLCLCFIASTNHFAESSFRNSELGSARLDNARLAYANLYGARAGAAILRGSDCRNADFSHADLRGADFSGANLYVACLHCADTRHTQWTGANMLLVRGTDEALARAECWQPQHQLDEARKQGLA